VDRPEKGCGEPGWGRTNTPGRKKKTEKRGTGKQGNRGGKKKKGGTGGIGAGKESRQTGGDAPAQGCSENEKGGL